MTQIYRDALFADETEEYRYPFEHKAGDVVTFRFRVFKDNVDSVTLVTHHGRYEMLPESTKGCFQYYAVKMLIDDTRFRYCYEITSGDDICYYDRLGVREGRPEMSHSFMVLPGFTTPEWSRGAVIYQIFTDRFCNGNTENDVQNGEYEYLNKPVEHMAWDDLPENSDVHRFAGGDLEGVRQKLDYLKRLGVEVIYFNPLFVSPSNHKYDTQDYDHIDPHYTGFLETEAADNLSNGLQREQEIGRRNRHSVTDSDTLEYSNRCFELFVKEAHEKGIRIILDGVFNHCGSFNKWMDEERIYRDAGYPDGAFLSESSPYHNYFIFSEDSVWPDQVHYQGWWNHKTLPKLNYSGAEDLKNEILRISKKWITEPYCIDGWRLDVAADLGKTAEENHRFWQEFRNEVKNANKDAVIIAEHYGNPEKWLRGNEWDSVMNYDAFMDPVGYFLTGLEKHSLKKDEFLHGNGAQFFRDLAEKMSVFPMCSLQSAMNELSNHDHTRFLTRTNQMIGRLEASGSKAAEQGVSFATFREGVVMQFTLPGSPTIYYGDEAGLCGWTDPDDRRTYPWGHENWALIEMHREMSKIHCEHQCLRTGSFKPLQWDYGYIAYGRFDKDSSVLVTVNHSERERQEEIPVYLIEMNFNASAVRVMQTGDAMHNVGQKEYSIVDGVLKVILPPWSATVFINKR